MTSKIIVNNIGSDTGINTVTFDSNVVRGGSNLHSTGLALGAGSTVGAVTGVTTYYGDGSQLTGISVDSTKIETGNTKVETIDTGSDGHVKVTTEGTEKFRITSGGDVAITTRGTVEGVSKLNVEIPARTTAFSASDGDTWHDVLIENPGSATTNAIGLCFQVTGDPYHKNAGTGIAAVKNGTNSDYGSDLVFITRPQSAVASEKLRISSEGYVTNPTRPCFDVAKDDGAVSSTNAIVFNVVNVNNGSHYDTSNGRFTAPVTGTYFLYFGGIKNNSSSTVRLKLLKNGTGNYMNSDREIRYDTGGNYGENASMNVIASLTATDYVQVYVTAGTIYGTDASYTHFGGYLLS